MVYDPREESLLVRRGIVNVEVSVEMVRRTSAFAEEKTVG